MIYFLHFDVRSYEIVDGSVKANIAYRYLSTLYRRSENWSYTD